MENLGLGKEVWEKGTFKFGLKERIKVHQVRRVGKMLQAEGTASSAFLRRKTCLRLLTD